MQEEIEFASINNKEEIVKILNSVYEKFIEGLFEDAIELLEEALKIDFEYPGVTTALKCANFWQERLEKLRDISDFYERGEFLVNHWLLFNRFIGDQKRSSQRCVYNLKQYIYSQALENYQRLIEDSEIYDTEILLKIGRCYKGIGNYDKAIEYIETAMQQKTGAAEILAELADCYSLINETRLSKAFFREAFFIDPGSINLMSLESGMIKKLIQKMTEIGITESELHSWIPVYGTIFGVFNIKRELKPLELGKLKQSIYKLEKQIQSEFKRTVDNIPELINHYFWLIDHMISTGEEKPKIEEILHKIKELDYNIYKEYTN